MSAADFIRRTLTAYRIKWDTVAIEDYALGKDRAITTMDAADIVSSEKRGERRHVVALDLDYPAYLVESSTPGHFHLYLDVPGGVPHDGYMALVALLGHLNVIEPGYATASLARGHTDLRPPWVKKGQEPGRAAVAEPAVVTELQTDRVGMGPTPTVEAEEADWRAYCREQDADWRNEMRHELAGEEQ